MEWVHKVHLVQLYLDRQILQHAEQVQHEPVAGQGPLLHLELRSLLVALQQLRYVTQADVPALLVGHHEVEDPGLARPGVLQLQLQRLDQALVAGQVAGEELLRHLRLILREHRYGEEGAEERRTHQFPALRRSAGFRHELHLLRYQRADGTRAATYVGQLVQGVDGDSVLVSDYALGLHHFEQVLQNRTENVEE